ncbi:MFS transporter [Sinomonas atrocyanea]|uniref:MFS transporter n=1 Tax=Sinomonas atrocyanea TaxID=37927 RepID=UPI0027D7E50A|nr:MFS transporter [Sinomonas atrocyanea]
MPPQREGATSSCVDQRRCTSQDGNCRSSCTRRTRASGGAGPGPGPDVHRRLLLPELRQRDRAAPIAPKPKAERPKPAAVLRSLAPNRGLVSLIVAALVLLVAMGITQGVTASLWLDYFGNGSLKALASLATYLPAFVIAPFATRLGLRLGKKEFAVAGLVLTVVALTVLYFSHSHNPWVYTVANLIAGVSLGLFNMLIWAFITDVIDFQEVRTGQRDDGTVYATFSWAHKVGPALLGGLSGAVLTFIGYQATTGKHVQQSAGTLDGLFAFSTVDLAAFYLVIALVLVFSCPLNRRAVEQNAAILAGRPEVVEVARGAPSDARWRRSPSR